MPQFFELPRELRDMIYMAIITWEDPRPTLQHTTSVYGWNRLWDHQSWDSDGPACMFSSKKAPTTCVNILAANRRINEEMKQTINRAREQRLMLARMDCMVKNEKNHYFTWLSIPVVHNTRSATNMAKNKMVSGWASSVPIVRRLLAVPQRRQSIGGVTTSIEQLQVDIRLLEIDLATQRRDPSEQTGWAICAALKRVCENDPERFSRPTTIDTLVLNIVSSDRPTKNTPAQESSTGVAQPMSVANDLDDARVVARELINVWNKLWSIDESKGRYYRSLLERIQRVRVCVDEVLVRERELSLELERGQAEGRRIAQRVGW